MITTNAELSIDHKARKLLVAATLPGPEALISIVPEPE